MKSFNSSVQPTLSACLIVKNEAQHLVACLESIKALAQEIIVVDTGSTDQTLDIARRYTSKVFSVTWENHFSKARNVALEQATGDWILVIDADEIMPVETAQRIPQYITRPAFQQACVLNFRVCSQHHPDLFSRGLFPNGYGIEFVGRVHEVPALPGVSLPAYHCDDLLLWHDSLGNHDRAKLAYYQGLMLQELKETTDAWRINHLQKHLGLTYLALTEWSQAWDTLSACQAGMRKLQISPQDGFYVDVLRGLVKAGQYAKPGRLRQYLTELKKSASQASWKQSVFNLRPITHRVLLLALSMNLVSGCQPSNPLNQQPPGRLNSTPLLLEEQPAPKMSQAPSLTDSKPFWGDFRIQEFCPGHIGAGYACYAAGGFPMTGPRGTDPDGNRCATFDYCHMPEPEPTPTPTPAPSGGGCIQQPGGPPCVILPGGGGPTPTPTPSPQTQEPCEECSPIDFGNILEPGIQPWNPPISRQNLNELKNKLEKHSNTNHPPTQALIQTIQQQIPSIASIRNTIRNTSNQLVNSPGRSVDKNVRPHSLDEYEVEFNKLQEKLLVLARSNNMHNLVNASNLLADEIELYQMLLEDFTHNKFVPQATFELLKKFENKTMNHKELILSKFYKLKQEIEQTAQEESLLLGELHEIFNEVALLYALENNLIDLNALGLTREEAYSELPEGGFSVQFTPGNLTRLKDAIVRNYGSISKFWSKHVADPAYTQLIKAVNGYSEQDWANIEAETPGIQSDLINAYKAILVIAPNEPIDLIPGGKQSKYIRGLTDLELGNLINTLKRGRQELSEAGWKTQKKIDKRINDIEGEITRREALQRARTRNPLSGKCKVVWDLYNHRHWPQTSKTWNAIIESTTKGKKVARYKPGVNIKATELEAWNKGTLVARKDGVDYVVYEFSGIIGASVGQETKFIRVERTLAGSLHGHPIPEHEYRQYMKGINE